RIDADPLEHRFGATSRAGDEVSHAGRGGGQNVPAPIPRRLAVGCKMLCHEILAFEEMRRRFTPRSYASHVPVEAGSRWDLRARTWRGGLLAKISRGGRINRPWRGPRSGRCRADCH